MMSRRIARLCLALALIGGATLIAITWNGHAQTFDRRDRAAVVRALQAATGRNFIADNLCIATPEHFPDLVIIESMVPDAGCLLEGWFVRGRWQRRETGLLERLAQEQLAARGWAGADADTRRTLALQWVAEVTGAGRVVTNLATLDPRFLGQGITEPATETRPDGGVIVRIWVIRMTVAGTNPARVTFMFGPDGTPGR
jgi:hypothetical protein